MSRYRKHDVDRDFANMSDRCPGIGNMTLIEIMLTSV